MVCGGSENGGGVVGRKQDRKAEKTAQLCMVTKSLDILPASLVSWDGTLPACEVGEKPCTRNLSFGSRDRLVCSSGRGRGVAGVGFQTKGLPS